VSSEVQAIYATTLLGEQRSAGSIRRRWWMSSEVQEIRRRLGEQRSAGCLYDHASK